LIYTIIDYLPSFIVRPHHILPQVSSRVPNIIFEVIRMTFIVACLTHPPFIAKFLFIAQTDEIK
jgi:hypothetical protein